MIKWQKFTILSASATASLSEQHGYIITCSERDRLQRSGFTVVERLLTMVDSQAVAVVQSAGDHCRNKMSYSI